MLRQSNGGNKHASDMTSVLQNQLEQAKATIGDQQQLIQRQADYMTDFEAKIID